MKMQGRVGIITGAGSGIGAATARLLAAEGTRLLLVDQNAAGLAEVKAAIAGAGGTAETMEADVSLAAPPKAAVADLMQRWGRLDTVITCAGISTGGTVETMDEAAWDKVFAVNVRGTYTWLHASIPALVKTGGGTIVMIASQLAYSSGGNNAGYIATKGAILSLTKTMAVDHAKQNIRVNAVAPGIIDTPMPRRSLATRFKDPEGQAKIWAARHAMGRFGKPEELAKAILYLASDDSSFVTGHTLVVDGGWTAM
ncbi:MAG: glucose 1-dehydrogenase [Alphaproteobacteria bacterium]|nr:glucose 1-dehydrogenase [Alphaproteobacteria bacterium]